MFQNHPPPRGNQQGADKGPPPLRSPSAPEGIGVGGRWLVTATRLAMAEDYVQTKPP